jgi:2,5-diamino-6-(ribosylamino)-4(3H)-pyrimidinone 5'-phosphate reductase
MQVVTSGPEDFDRVDALRADCDAVMVGVGTVLADDPSLTVESPDRGERRERDRRSPNPARVVADSRVRTPAEVVTAGESRVNLAAGLADLDDRGVGTVLVEGGGELVFSLFQGGLVDRLSTFVGPSGLRDGGDPLSVVVTGQLRERPAEPFLEEVQRDSLDRRQFVVDFPLAVGDCAVDPLCEPEHGDVAHYFRGRLVALGEHVEQPGWNLEFVDGAVRGFERDRDNVCICHVPAWGNPLKRLVSSHADGRASAPDRAVRTDEKV